MNERIIKLYIILFYIGLNQIFINSRHYSATTNFTRFLVSLIVLPILLPLAVIKNRTWRDGPGYRYPLWMSLRADYWQELDNMLIGIGNIVIVAWTKTRLKFSKKARREKEWDELFNCCE